ncbi:S-adenosyl-L-methionine-dependent methyltransferase [Viridothelium virens]|uniref:S-adenosyl-L-methionine-dependent methyltransferase n=1 Tax=Viridothelium virens TaxID=1048519 RepID=A0A6A6H6F2_VIRVR|nr:S-adenosyl-L-methionine-dependent methyltransferase [Viridothelium virens]
MASSSDVTANLTNSFNNAADTYERRMGTATRAVARHIISSLPSLPPNPTICDNACGTGAITKAFLDRYPHGHVYATDNSPGMVELMRQNIDQSGWSGKVKVEVMDSVRLHLPDNSVDANTMNFGIFFTSDAQRAADEIVRHK